jgi:hypothetical protein
MAPTAAGSCLRTNIEIDDTLMAEAQKASQAARDFSLFRFKVLEPDPTSRAQAVPRLFDTAQEARVMLKTVFEPVFFRFEADQHTRRFAMARDDDLLRLCLAKESRQIVLDF